MSLGPFALIERNGTTVSKRQKLAQERYTQVDADTFDERGPQWEGETGYFRTHPLSLEAGWFTVTWSLEQGLNDVEDSFLFQAALLNSEGQLISNFPLDEESALLGYHTATVHLKKDESYFFTMRVEHAIWKLALLRIATGS